MSKILRGQYCHLPTENHFPTATVFKHFGFRNSKVIEALKELFFVRGLYLSKFTILEIKIENMWRHTVFLGWKNQNDITTQGKLHIQYHLCQNTKDNFHRTKTNNFKIRMETQKSLNSQDILGKEEQTWTESCSLTWDYITKPVLAPKQTHRWMQQKNRHIDECNRAQSPGTSSVTYGRLIYEREAKIYNGEKTVLKSAGKTGQLCVQWD